MNDASEGAFTGEISASMLKEAGAKFVIIGHSERRRLFGESNEFINRKLKKAFSSGLQPILCVGETGQEREEGKAEEVIHKQLKECLAGIRKTQFKKLIISYEPVWAIGTDKVATPDEAQAAQQFCRKQIAEIADEETALKISILYGGSVKPDNVNALLAEPDIDGVLVGGASLSVETFSKIVNFNKD
jgi:triosephosphate isomerase